MQIGIEHLRIAFVSCLSYQSTLSNGSGPRKEKEVENRYPDSLFVRIPLSTVLSPNLLFSPLFRLKRMHGICRWLGFLLHVLQPISRPALHHVLSSWSPSRHEEYLAPLLSYYLLIHHFLIPLSRIVILLRMHCVFSQPNHLF